MFLQQHICSWKHKHIVGLLHLLRRVVYYYETRHVIRAFCAVISFRRQVLRQTEEVQRRDKLLTCGLNPMTSKHRITVSKRSLPTAASLLSADVGHKYLYQHTTRKLVLCVHYLVIVLFRLLYLCKNRTKTLMINHKCLNKH